MKERIITAIEENLLFATDEKTGKKIIEIQVEIEENDHSYRHCDEITIKYKVEGGRKWHRMQLN